MRKLTARERYLLTATIIGSVSLWLGLPRDAGHLGRGNSGNGMEAMRLGEPPRLRLESLHTVTAPYDPRGRNLFEYHRPRRQRRPTLASSLPRVARPSGTIPTAAPKGTAQPRSPRPSFNYIGFLGPKDDLIAVFSRGTEIFVGQIGEVVDGSFELLEFRYDTVVLAYIGEDYEGEIVRLRMISG